VLTLLDIQVLADELARLEELVKGLDTDQKKEKDEALTLIKSIKGFFENRFEKSIPQQLKQAMLPDSPENEIPATEITEEIAIESTTPIDPVNIPSSAEKKKKKKKKKAKKPKDLQEKTESVATNEKEKPSKELNQNDNSPKENGNDNQGKSIVVEEKAKTEVKIEVVAPAVAKKETTSNDANTKSDKQPNQSETKQ
jgi:hypothetical protein